MDTTTEAQEILLCMYTGLVGDSILMYDHMATLPEEIAFIWRRPKALSATLFLVNRYFALLVNISCLVIIQVSFVFQAVVVCLIMAIRTYALYGGISAGSLGHYSSDAVLLPGVGCYETYTAATATRLGLAWLAEMVFQTLIFILTVYRIFKTRSLLRLSLVTRRNIVDIVFHDGAMYFGAMALVNIPNILTYYSGSVGIRGSLSTLTSCLSVTLVSRLMLNLHKSIDTGILSIPAQNEGPSLAVLTTRINVQSATSSQD
ncbi:uncharacterized protein EDB93DRAFT_296019 [Suillus bovinus]|uniref:uncharacterized protein n=1 Tax=Suillus bovinus TaxID=48563 RepID=UPI001B85F100|nr:uncharacterized protein EDB93DRAFT_296019 [Suillus bovinus]KAG2151155.1 hypothetical protein EDB93DRAFT_296019 [Suillus bovinus]